MRLIKKPKTIIFLIICIPCAIYAIATNIWFFKLFRFLFFFLIFVLAYEVFENFVTKKLDGVIAREQLKTQQKPKDKSDKT